MRCFIFYFLATNTEKLKSGKQATERETGLTSRGDGRIFINFSNPFVAFFINFVSVVSGILTIYGFIETREKPEDEDDTDPAELFEELGTYIEELKSDISFIKQAVLELTCRHEAAHNRRNPVSKDCAEYLLNLPEMSQISTTTKSPILRKPTSQTTSHPTSQTGQHLALDNLPNPSSFAATWWLGLK